MKKIIAAIYTLASLALSAQETIIVDYEKIISVNDDFAKKLKAKNNEIKVKPAYYQLTIDIEKSTYKKIEKNDNNESRSSVTIMSGGDTTIFKDRKAGTSIKEEESLDGKKYIVFGFFKKIQLEIEPY